MEFIDFIGQLKGVSNVNQLILSKLDMQSLINAGLVSKTWRNVIQEEKIWTLLLHQEIAAKPSWGQVYDRLLAQPSEHLIDDRDGSRTYRKLMQAVKTLEENWRKGKYHLRGVRIPKKDTKNTCEFITMDSNYIYIGHKKCGTINVLNRKTLTFEKDFPKHGEGLSFMQTDEIFLITACRKDGLMKLYDRESRKLIKTIAVPKDEKALITEFRVKSGLIVLTTLLNKDDPWATGKATIIAWRLEGPKIIRKVHEEAFRDVTVHHLGLDANYIALLFLLEGRKNTCDLNLSPEIELRSTTTFERLFTIKHGVENVYEFKFLNGMLAIGSELGIRIWNVDKDKEPRDISDSRMDDGRGVSVYGFNSNFIVGHLFSGPVLIWDLKKALENPKTPSKSLLLAEFPMRFDPDVMIDELEMVNLRHPHMKFLDDEMDSYDAGNHFEIIIKDFSQNKEKCFEKCSDACCLSDAEDYDM